MRMSATPNSMLNQTSIDYREKSEKEGTSIPVKTFYHPRLSTGIKNPLKCEL